MICQGTRDQFGSKDEVSGYELSSTIQMRWLEDGDHDLKPRKRISGFTHADHIASIGLAVSAWIEGLVG
jgi:predicted alpha/beta-hydrolase family hydrolase